MSGKNWGGTANRTAPLSTRYLQAVKVLLSAVRAFVAVAVIKLPEM